ncbi:hypothetical protein [Qipengyuania sediminis]|uniref:hypothetical protein n=1 Tax=Qipengyuania sediminis TaxID=1532023 RepID=UPI0010594517|nr:hypothetical protein [Qipengyuania sediminis]
MTLAPESPPAGDPPSAAGAPVMAEVEQTFPRVTVDGVALGAVTMRGDAVHLASLVGLFALRMPEAERARIAQSPAVDSFVSLDTLRAAGIAVTLDHDAGTIALTLS